MRRATLLNILPSGARRLTLPLLLSVLLPQGAAVAGVVDIERTTDGIPHIRAQNWRDLGRGIGYAQAEDALCTLAEGFLTYAGGRSREFGGDGRPASSSMLGRPTNRELDFFFRAFATRDAVRSWQQHQPAQLDALAEGYAAGYNQYLQQARQGSTKVHHRACLEQTWVRPITAADVVRRMLAAQWGGGLVHFIAPLVAAAAPVDGQAGVDAAPADDAPDMPPASAAVDGTVVPQPGRAAAEELRRMLRVRIGHAPWLGSNGMAFGEAVTGEGQSVLFGNPHWYWSGPDRFYQMHLTIPGTLNVAGAGFLGVPLVMVGFNEQVAWTHTVSTARRFSLYALQLEGGKPARYRVDEARPRLSQREVSIEVRGEDGRIRTERRTFRQSGMGPLIDLGILSPALKTTDRQAFVLRDVNAGNDQVFAQYLAWNQAGSLTAFIGIQRRMLASPWVNTLAIGRGEGRVWYGDLGAVPAERDDWVQRCVVPGTDMQAIMQEIGLPVLDGSRQACLPGGGSKDPAAARLAAQEMPGLLRQDYVANMNNSYWLTNAHAPLTGFPAVMGGEPDTLEMRARFGQQLALSQLERPVRSARALGDRLARELLTSEPYSARRYRAAVLETACGEAAPQSGAAQEGAQAGVRRACEVLWAWSGRADADARGALLWEAVWRAFGRAAERGVTGVPTGAPADPAKPLQEAPAGEKLRRSPLRAAMAEAVEDMRTAGLAPDAPLSATRVVSTMDGYVPEFGGCDEYGYFMVFCDSGAEEGGIEGNSYLQLVHFADDGVHARTLLAHGQDEEAMTAVSSGLVTAPGTGMPDAALRGSVVAPVVRYAQRRWLPFPFTAEQIRRDGVLSRVVLSTGGRQ